jgi:hypothetical protein
MVERTTKLIRDLMEINGLFLKTMPLMMNRYIRNVQGKDMNTKK